MQQAMLRAMRVLRAEPSVGPVLASLRRFGRGTALDRCGPLSELFDVGSGKALVLAEAFVAAGIAALEMHPMGRITLSHGTRDAIPSLVLARSGRATLTLAACDGDALARLPEPTTVRFQPTESWFLVLCGSGDGERIERQDRQDGGAELTGTAEPLSPGRVIHRYGPRSALHLHGVDGMLVYLRLERKVTEEPLVYEFRLSDGEPVHRTLADAGNGGRELAMAVLGAMERRDAIPSLTALSLRQGEGMVARWRALHELAGLDREAGLEVAQSIASTRDDSLAGHADRFSATLVGTGGSAGEGT